MKYRPNIEQILGVEPDFLGFIFFDKSPRNVGDSLRPEFVRFIHSVKKVGVFVNEKVSVINQKKEDFGLNMVQLHGSESPEMCHSLRQTGVEVIKVFSVGEDMDFSQLFPYETVVDYFLFDTKGKNPGGNGIAFDWEILSEYSLSVPFFLSGGIGLESLPMLTQFSHPQLYAWDVNSRFEVSPGEKDVSKVKLLKAELSASMFHQ